MRDHTISLTEARRRSSVGEGVACAAEARSWLNASEGVACTAEARSWLNASEGVACAAEARSWLNASEGVNVRQRGVSRLEIVRHGQDRARHMVREWPADAHDADARR
jgi:hypothetical protein